VSSKIISYLKVSSSGVVGAMSWDHFTTLYLCFIDRTRCIVT